MQNRVDTMLEALDTKIKAMAELRLAYDKESLLPYRYGWHQGALEAIIKRCCPDHNKVIDEILNQIQLTYDNMKSG